MKRIVLAFVLCLPGLAAAQAGLNGVTRQQLEEAQRTRAQQLAQERDARIQRARDKCNANHGTDCDTMEGLQEWLLLDRSRAEAVLDRIEPLGSASVGTSGVPGANVPDTSPRNSSAVPR